MSEEPKPVIPDNAPWWAKGILVVGHTFGVSAIILGFYLGQSVGIIPNPVEDRLAAIEDKLDKGSGQQQEIMGLVVQSTAMLKEQNQQRQVWCVLKAKSDDEKKACFPAANK